MMRVHVTQQCMNVRALPSFQSGLYRALKFKAVHIYNHDFFSLFFASGLKDTLFDVYLLEDAAYLGVAGVFIFLAILAYSQSFFLTLVTILAIVFALGWAYAIYTFILGIEFFPFMNILAGIIAIGMSLRKKLCLLAEFRIMFTITSSKPSTPGFG